MKKTQNWELVNIADDSYGLSVKLPGRENLIKRTAWIGHKPGKNDLALLGYCDNDPQKPICISPKNKIKHISPLSPPPIGKDIWPIIMQSFARDRHISANEIPKLTNWTELIEEDEWFFSTMGSNYLGTIYPDWGTGSHIYGLLPIEGGTSVEELILARPSLPSGYAYLSPQWDNWFFFDGETEDSFIYFVKSFMGAKYIFEQWVYMIVVFVECRKWSNLDYQWQILVSEGGRNKEQSIPSSGTYFVDIIKLNNGKLITVSAIYEYNWAWERQFLNQKEHYHHIIGYLINELNPENGEVINTNTITIPDKPLPNGLRGYGQVQLRGVILNESQDTIIIGNIDGYCITAINTADLSLKWQEIVPNYNMVTIQCILQNKLTTYYQERSISLFDPVYWTYKFGSGEYDCWTLKYYGNTPPKPTLPFGEYSTNKDSVFATFYGSELNAAIVNEIYQVTTNLQNGIQAYNCNDGTIAFTALGSGYIPPPELRETGNIEAGTWYIGPFKNITAVYVAERYLPANTEPQVQFPDWYENGEFIGNKIFEYDENKESIGIISKRIRLEWYSGNPPTLNQIWRYERDFSRASPPQKNTTRDQYFIYFGVRCEWIRWTYSIAGADISKYRFCTDGNAQIISFPEIINNNDAWDNYVEAAENNYCATSYNVLTGNRAWKTDPFRRHKYEHYLGDDYITESWRYASGCCINDKAYFCEILNRRFDPEKYISINIWASDFHVINTITGTIEQSEFISRYTDEYGLDWQANHSGQMVVHMTNYFTDFDYRPYIFYP